MHVQICWSMTDFYTISMYFLIEEGIYIVKFNSKLITMLVQYIYNNPQQHWSKAGQRGQSLTQDNVQKQEGGTEATAVLLRVLPSLFRHQRGAFMCTVWGCQHYKPQPIGEILREAVSNSLKKKVPAENVMSNQTHPPPSCLNIQKQTSSTHVRPIKLSLWTPAWSPPICLTPLGPYGS